MVPYGWRKTELLLMKSTLCLKFSPSDLGIQVLAYVTKQNQKAFMVFPWRLLMRFSTGGVDQYTPNGCAGPDLEHCVEQADILRQIYSLANFESFTHWRNGDIWGSDFRDSAGGDLASDGGSDVPDIYYISCHGSCQNPPTSTSPDFLSVCGNFGKPNRVEIGKESRWGNGRGIIKFMFIDASCPMDLISIENQWFPVFLGLHMAVGHSGTSSQDTLDSSGRAGNFAFATSGGLWWLIPDLSVGDAWMYYGTEDIEDGCCAVALAAGRDRGDAIDRRENERILDNRTDPAPNWFAWKWVCE